MSPPAMRSNVDLPEPERPRRPRISPSGSVASISASTGKSSPDAFANAMQTFRISMIGCVAGAAMPAQSIEPRAALGEGIKRSPQQSIHRDDEQRHDGNPESDPRIVAGFCHLGDIRAQPRSAQFGRSPADGLGDDARIPGTAGGGDRAGNIIGEDPGKQDLPPPAPRPNPKACGSLPEVARECTRAGDHIEEDVPLCPEDHQGAEPDSRCEAKADDHKNRERK